MEGAERTGSRRRHATPAWLAVQREHEERQPHLHPLLQAVLQALVHSVAVVALQVWQHCKGREGGPGAGRGELQQHSMSQRAHRALRFQPFPPAPSSHTPSPALTRPRLVEAEQAHVHVGHSHVAQQARQLGRRAQRLLAGCDGWGGASGGGCAQRRHRPI